MTDYRRPQVLDTSRHNRDHFDCGEDELNTWLQRYAGQNRRRNTAATWVVVDAFDNIAAYASVSMTAVARASAPETLAKHSPDPVPALLLGRLAVDRPHTGGGLGTALVAHVLATAVELNASAACRAVVVTALNARAREWWERLGFSPFEPDDPNALDMYLLTTDIAATIADLQ